MKTYELIRDDYELIEMAMKVLEKTLMTGFTTIQLEGLSAVKMAMYIWALIVMGFTAHVRST